MEQSTLPACCKAAPSSEGIDRAIAAAEAATKRLRDAVRPLNDLAWTLDSGLSALRKAKAGYRSSAILGDAQWDIAPIVERLRRAITTADDVITKACQDLIEL